MAHMFMKFLKSLDVEPQESFRLYDTEEDDYFDERVYFFTDNKLFFIDEKGFMKSADDKLILDILRNKYIIDHIEFRPKTGETYWTFISDSMDPIDVVWYDSFIDHTAKKLNIIYETYEKAMEDRANAFEKITGRKFVPK